jgi:hypothetical protein
VLPTLLVSQGVSAIEAVSIGFSTSNPLIEEANLASDSKNTSINLSLLIIKYYVALQESYYSLG